MNTDQHEIRQVWRHVAKFHEPQSQVGDKSYGITGHVTPGSYAKIVNALKTYGGLNADSVFLDVGSGMGRPSFGAFQVTGCMAIGIEKCDMLVNISTIIGKKYSRGDIQFGQGDILKLESFAGVDYVYSFSTGMPHHILRRIVFLAVQSNVKMLVMYKNAYFTDMGLDNNAADVQKLNMKMPSGSSYTCYIIPLTEERKDNVLENISEYIQDGSNTIVSSMVNDMKLTRFIEQCRLHHVNVFNHIKAFV